jgi:hypothetical protein
VKIGGLHLTLLTNALRQTDTEESKGKKEEDFSANPSKKIHWKKIPFSTARFASIRFRPWQLYAFSVLQPGICHCLQINSPILTLPPQFGGLFVPDHHRPQPAEASWRPRLTE